MNKTIQELVPLIQEWAKERGIFDKSTPFDQLLKTHEEVGEPIKASYDNDRTAVQDAIGDVMVTLIILKHLNNITHSANTTLEECLNIAYNEIKDIKEKMINGKFVKNEE
ncbi:MazG-like family protein [Capnocytophaga granulosa]|uniref:MazG-like family protein n=1 Tax=Capnocytophaga granulosa TaxID=45242 RepID=UPI0028D90A14|nr:MazG-like family protein [Capnocytophaga granulosa]